MQPERFGIDVAQGREALDALPQPPGGGDEAVGSAREAALIVEHLVELAVDDGELVLGHIANTTSAGLLL